MATIQSLLTDNSSNITSQTAAGAITPTIDGAERVKVINELLSRGITVVADTTELQTVSGANFKQAIVESDAVYKWAASGTPNGTTIFAASGGGVWNQIFSGGGGTWGSITGTLSSQSDLQSALNAKQATLVSATNIKTINGSSVLGAGDLTVTASSSTFEVLTDGATISWNFSTVKKGTVTLGGNRTLSLSNTSDGDAGLLLVKQDATGGRTLALPGNKEVGLVLSTGANEQDLLGFVNVDGTLYWFIGKLGATDSTAPTVTSATAINATTIRLVFSETVYATNVGHTFTKNGSAHAASAISGSGSNTLDFTVPTMLNTDTLLRSYNSTTGDTVDAAANELVDYASQAVTNSIASSEEFIPFDTVTSGVTESPTNTYNAAAANKDMVWTLKKMPGDGYIQMDNDNVANDLTCIGLDVESSLEPVATTGTVNWKVGAYLTGNVLYSFYEGVLASTQLNQGSSTLIVKIRLRRTGTTLKLQKSTDGTNYTDVYTYPNAISGDLYCKVTFLAAKSCVNAKAYSFS